MNAITLHPAVPEDEDFLFRLYSSTRADELSAWGLPVAQQEAFLRMQYIAQKTHYVAAFPGLEHQIVSLNNVPAGRLMVWRGEHDIRVVDIALLPEQRNKGIGTALIEEILTEGEQTGKTVTLHVLKGSPAFRLYDRLGFKPVQDEQMYFFLEKKPLSKSAE